MFTGIIRAVANVEQAQEQGGSLLLKISKPRGWKIKAGDSISTDGACLTVRKVHNHFYTVQLVPETLRATYFSRFIPKKVNLEPSLTSFTWLDGHIVLGHVDTVGTIKKIQSRGRSRMISISYSKRFAHLVASKGSVAIDGISLTVVQARHGTFSVSLVDYTLRHATIGEKKVGDLVNLEFDIIAKYIHAGRRFPRTIQGF